MAISLSRFVRNSGPALFESSTTRWSKAALRMQLGQQPSSTLLVSSQHLSIDTVLILCPPAVLASDLFIPKTFDDILNNETSVTTPLDEWASRGMGGLARSRKRPYDRRRFLALASCLRWECSLRCPIYFSDDTCLLHKFHAFLSRPLLLRLSRSVSILSWTLLNPSSYKYNLKFSNERDYTASSTGCTNTANSITAPTSLLSSP